jgi:peptide-methionine (R)-S-oxide reductase
MFDRDAGTDLTRRGFLATAMYAVGGGALFTLIRPSGRLRVPVVAAGGLGAAPLVTIVEFSDAGVKLKTERVQKIVKTEEEWRKQLSPLAFSVTRHGDTEFAFSGEFWNLHEKGIFRCICCDTALFSSDNKFDSGTGWPSFWKPMAEENVLGARERHRSADDSEVQCRRCDAHLGDLFFDGPDPTGLRYCIDSVALRFAKAT